MVPCCAVCFSVLQCAAVCCSVLQCVAVCCSVLQCVAVCCSVLQFVVMWCIVVQCSAVDLMNNVVAGGQVCWQCVAVCCSVLQCVVVDMMDNVVAGALDCVAVWYSDLVVWFSVVQCVAVRALEIMDVVVFHNGSNCNTLQHTAPHGTATHCNTLQCVAVCCNIHNGCCWGQICAAVYCSVLQGGAMWCSVVQYGAV